MGKKGWRNDQEEKPLCSRLGTTGIKQIGSRVCCDLSKGKIRQDSREDCSHLEKMNKNPQTNQPPPPSL